MPPTWGTTATGWKNKTFQEFLTEMRADYEVIHGAINWTENSYINHDVTVIAKICADFAEVLQGIYNAGVSDNAQDVLLENVFSLVNVGKLIPKKSTNTVTLTNNTASPATVPISSIVKQSSTNTQWFTLSEVEIPANDTIDVDVESENYGAFSSPIGSIDTIVTTIAGWVEVTNASEGQLGREEETDPEYRSRKETAVVTSKGGTKEATRNYILENVAGVTYCNVEQNRTDAVVDGMNPHSIKVTVVGGTTQDICNAILKCNGNGINTNGDVTGTGIDDVGNEEEINFYRATEITIYIVVDLTVNGNYDTANNDVIKQLIYDYGQTLREGQEVKKWELSTQINPTIDGIDDVAIKLGTSPAPSGTSNITINANEKAKILLSNIVINNI